MSTPALRRLRGVIAPVTKTLLFRGGVYSVVRRLHPSRQVAILRYHAICGPEGHAYADPTICVSPDAFRRHVAYLASNYRVLPLPDVVTALRRRQSLPVNCVAITFDDGYADNLNAARVLHAQGLTATFYITAGCLTGGEAFWLSELRALIARIPGPENHVTVGARELKFRTDTAGSRHAAIRRLSSLVKSNPIRVREDLRSQLRHLAGDPVVESPMLTWAEVRQIEGLGMTIGAHTLTHPNLPSAEPDAAWTEIDGARARLERELGSRVTMFSYPNGGAERYVTPRIQQLVREAGYDAATTSVNGFAGLRSDPYALERVQVAERLEDLAFALEVERFAFAPKERARAGA